MKNIVRSILFLVFVFALVLPAHADYTESVRVIRADKKKNDLIIERKNGERLLLQHNRVCNSMSTEYPVSILWGKNNKIKELKVAFNERCKVYNFGKYAGEMKIEKRILSNNLMVKEHEAEVIYKGKKYKIDYEKGCTYMREFLGKNAYVSLNRNRLKGGTIYLPGARGMCKIKKADLLGVVEGQKEETEPIKELQHQAQNNKVYFYWKKSELEKPLYLISHSRYKINPEDYTWKQMPKLRYSRRNSYTVRGLANNKTYHFYLAVLTKDKVVSEWKHVELKPKNTSFVYRDSPDLEKFEVTIKEETDDYYLLTWPNKEDDSKRYILQFFVNGKRVTFKYLKANQNEFKIIKKPEYKGKKFRLAIRTLSKKRFGKRYSDGIYWEDKEK